MIFSRDRGSGKHVRPVVAGKAGRHVRDRNQSDTGPDFDEDGDEGAPGREYGPFDISEAPEDDVTRVDLGALHIPVLPGVQLGMQGTQDGRAQVIVQDGDGALNLVAFAAPRSEGIWDEVREEYRISLAADRANPVEEDGEYGPELHARPRTPNAPAEIRFVGVDGPRWFVQALFQGKAASAGYDGPLRAVLRGLIVDRGNQAMPVREQLPLRLPPQAQAELQAAQAAQAAQQAAASPAPRMTPAQVINAAPSRPSFRSGAKTPAETPATETPEADAVETPAATSDAAETTDQPAAAKPAPAKKAQTRPAATRAARGRGPSRGA